MTGWVSRRQAVYLTDWIPFPEEKPPHGGYPMPERDSLPPRLSLGGRY